MPYSQYDPSPRLGPQQENSVYCEIRDASNSTALTVSRSTVLNCDHSIHQQPRGTKRKKRTQGGRGMKHSKQTPAITNAPALSCGIGPSIALALDGSRNTPTSDTATCSLSQQTSMDNSCTSTSGALPGAAASVFTQGGTITSATDIWYFVRPLDTPEEPASRPDCDSELCLTRKPSSQYIGCKLCQEWKVWKLTESVTSCVRRHMKNKHLEAWGNAVEEIGLKGANGNVTANETLSYRRENGLFSYDHFYHLLMRWIVVDDQAMNLLDCQEFRNLILYIAGDDLTDDELPHRTKLTQDILLEHEKMFSKLHDSMSNALGRISFTSDLWSDVNLRSFMAVTSHFILYNQDGMLEYRSALVAFTHVEEAHSGKNLGTIFYNILEKYEITHKIGVVTMDNASNNNTFMEQLEQLLVEKGVDFDRDGNRIRCFPHIINLACQAFIEELKINPQDLLHSNFSLPPLPSASELIVPNADNPSTHDQLSEYSKTLSKDLIGKCRSLVSACRVSGQRRAQLHDIIIEGNENGYWPEKIPVLELLRDCETRWSSTYLMIDRVIRLYPAIRAFLLRNSDFSRYLFSDNELKTLHDIRQVLQVPHSVQELLSAERTPTLSLALPAYETLLDLWRILQTQTIPELSHYIGIGIAKVENYVSLARNTRMYAHAMVLNPTMKFMWMKDNWSSERVQEARSWILKSMTSYQTELREDHEKQASKSLTPQASTSIHMGQAVSAVDSASNALSYAYSRFRGLDVFQRHASGTGAPLASQNPSPTQLEASSSTSGLSRTPSLQDLEDDKARKLAEDRRVAERELDLYESYGLISLQESTASLVNFWEVSSLTFPLMFRIAMDGLPAQASAVSCERVFSSSKETSTLRRSRISPALFEALQVLKFSYRQDRLVFTSDIQLAKDEDYTISGPVTLYAAQELTENRQYEELAELISNAEAEGHPPPVLELEELV